MLLLCFCVACLAADASSDCKEVTSNNNYVFTECFFDSLNGGEDGGAIFISGAELPLTVTVKSATFYSCHSTHGGGAVFANFRNEMTMTDLCASKCSSVQGHFAYLIPETTKLLSQTQVAIFDCGHDRTSDASGAIYVDGKNTPQFQSLNFSWCRMRGHGAAMTMTTSPAQVTATFTSTSKCRGKTIFHITGAQAVTWEYCGFYDNSLTSDGICHAWMEITGGVTFKECRFGGDFTWAGGPSNTDPTWVGCYGNCGSCAGEALSVSLTAFVTTYCALPPDPRNDTFVDASATFSKSNGLSVSRAMTDSFKMAPTGPVNPSSDIAPSYSHPNSNACPPTAQIVVSSDLPPSVNVTASAPHEVTTALEISADLPPSAVIGSSVELNDSAAIRPSGVLPATVPLRISSFLPPSLPIAPSVLPNVSAAFPRTNAFPATGLIANSNQHPPTKPLVVSDVFLSQPIADSLNFRETNDHNETAEFSPSKTFSGSQPLVSQKIDFSAKFASTASLLPATSPSPSASASPLDPTAEFSLSEDLKGIDGSGSGGGGLAIGAILGIVFAILFLLALAAAGGLYYQKVILPRNQKKESSEVHDYTAEFFHGQQKEQEHEMSVDFNNPMFDDAVGADEDDTFEQNLKSDPDEML